MPKKVTENQLQKQIIDYLRLKEYLAVKFPSVGIYNKKTGSYIPMPQRGVSDILFWGHSIFGAIECKMKPKKPTPEQLQFLEDMKYRDGMAIVAYSLDDVIEKI